MNFDYLYVHTETVHHLFRVILDLFSAGTETTATSLDWALLYMIAKPEIQQKCFNQIVKVQYQQSLVFNNTTTSLGKMINTTYGYLKNILIKLNILSVFVIIFVKRLN